MKIQRAWMISLSMMAVFVAAVSPAQGQFPTPHPTPGYHPAAHPYQIMMGQEGYDPTWIGADNYGDTCCGPNWYDFLIEWSYIRRDDAGRYVPYSSEGIAGAGAPNVVLSSADLDLNYVSGLRTFARYQLGAVHNIEVGYMGILDWNVQASATSDNHGLYSAFSDFGNVPFGGFEDVDQATLHSIHYRTDLDTVELNLRRSWASGNYRVWGSWLAGFRYMKLHDRFRFFADVEPHFDPINGVDRDAAETDYRITTDNDLYGSQIGGELGMCLIPGLNISGELKAGMFGNAAAFDSVLASTSLDPLYESASTNDVAFISEAGVYMMYQVHPLVKIRGGYQFLYVDGIALATENFDNAPPFLGNQRTVFLNDNGSAFFHGGLVGVEIGW